MNMNSRINIFKNKMGFKFSFFFFSELCSAREIDNSLQSYTSNIIEEFFVNFYDLV